MIHLRSRHIGLEISAKTRGVVEASGTAIVSLVDLLSVRKPRRWEKFFDEVPKDAWDREFIYKYPGTNDPNRPEVISKGKDEENSSDDISSQDPK